MDVFPGIHLVGWCRNLPGEFGLRLVHLELICAAQDMTPLFLEGEAIWQAFQGTLLKEDIPVRMAARLCSAMGTLEFLLRCLSAGVSVSPAAEALAGDQGGTSQAAAWAQVLRSFEQLQERLCGPAHAASWLRAALMGQVT